MGFCCYYLFLEIIHLLSPNLSLFLACVYPSVSFIYYIPPRSLLDTFFDLILEEGTLFPSFVFSYDIHFHFLLCFEGDLSFFNCTYFLEERFLDLSSLSLIILST